MKEKFTQDQIAKIYSNWLKIMLSRGIDKNIFLPILIRAAKFWFNISEEWICISDFEESYMISNFGRLKSLVRTINTSHNSVRTIKSRITLGYKKENDYLYVGLSECGIIKNKYVHRLVLDAFVLNENNKPQVNHKDGIKINNFYLNLEWMTCSENQKHAYKTGIRSIIINNNKPVIQKTIDGYYVDKFDSAINAERKTEILSTSISRACNNKMKTAGGYKWEFLKY